MNNTPSVQENKPCGNKIMSNYKNPQNSRGKIFKLARHVSKQNFAAGCRRDVIIVLSERHLIIIITKKHFLPPFKQRIISKHNSNRKMIQTYLK